MILERLKLVKNIVFNPSINRRAGSAYVLRLPDGVNLEMIWCPPGSFMMGSPLSEEGRRSNEILHRVCFTHGFWIGKYAVTQRQWECVMGDNPSSCRTSPNCPVETVSWSDCLEFCHKSGLGLRLPTEAEWEYACRAGMPGPFAGAEDIDDVCWSHTNSGHMTHDVGEKKPNAWGLYDMLGNVNEWCADLYGDYSCTAVVDPEGADIGCYRVSRGGDWGADDWPQDQFCWDRRRPVSKCCRAASRGFEQPHCKCDIRGFRVACP